jgi:hypothetical protein
MGGRELLLSIGGHSAASPASPTSTQCGMGYGLSIGKQGGEDSTVYVIEGKLHDEEGYSLKSGQWLLDNPRPVYQGKEEALQVASRAWRRGYLAYTVPGDAALHHGQLRIVRV